MARTNSLTNRIKAPSVRTLRKAGERLEGEGSGSSTRQSSLLSDTLQRSETAPRANSLKGSAPVVPSSSAPKVFRRDLLTTKSDGTRRWSMKSASAPSAPRLNSLKGSAPAPVLNTPSTQVTTAPGLRANSVKGSAPAPVLNTPSTQVTTAPGPRANSVKGSAPTPVLNTPSAEVTTAPGLRANSLKGSAPVVPSSSAPKLFRRDLLTTKSDGTRRTWSMKSASAPSAPPRTASMSSSTSSTSSSSVRSVDSATAREAQAEFDLFDSEPAGTYWEPRPNTPRYTATPPQMSQFFSPRPQPLYPQYPLDPATGISLGDYPYRSIDADGKVFHESERSYKAGPGFPGFHPNNSGLLQLPGQKTFFRIEPYVTTKANWGWNGGPAESTLGLSSKDGTDLARFIKADKLVRYVKAALEQKKKTYAKHKKTLEDFRVTHGDTLSEEIGKPSSGLAASFSKRRNSMRSSSLNSSVARPAFSMPLGGPRLNSLKLGTTQFSVFDTPAVPAAYPDAFNRTTAGRANSFRTATKAPTDFPYPSTPGPRSSQTEDPSRHPRSNSLRNTSSTGKPQLAPVPLPAAPVPVPGSRSGNGLEPIELSLGQPIAPGSGPVDGREFVSPQQRPAQFVGTKSRVAGNYTGVPTAFQPTLGTEEVDPLAMGDHIPTPHVVAPAPTISRPETPLSTRINFLEGYVSSQADTSGIQYSIDELAKLRQLNNASPDSRRIGWLEYEEERGNVAPGSDEKAELDRLKAAKRAAAEAIRDADELAEEAGVKKNSK